MSSMDGSSYEVGRQAAELLLARIDNPDRAATLQLITPSLAPRSTSGPPGEGR